MSCSTCDHTMERLPASSQGDETTTYLCPRCGTVKIEESGEAELVYVPKLVVRCREFETTLGPSWDQLWHRLGIAESINTPDNRPKGTL